MARIKDSILQKKSAYAGTSPVSDLRYGGQNGYMAKIGRVGKDGKNAEEWISNQAYVQRNIIPVVIRAPKFFNYMPEPKKWIETYKALIELHALTITGLNSGLTVETDEHAVGGAGEKQEEVTNVLRTRSTINTTYKEKVGKSIIKFLDYCIRYGMMDPDTKKPLVANIMKNLDNDGGIYTADFYTGTILFIEPDVTHTVVNDAWLCTNVFPKSNGERTGKRDINSAGETIDISIDWSSITMSNEVVMDMADKVLKNLTVLNTLPDTDMALPSSEIDANVASSEVGYNEVQK